MTSDRFITNRTSGGDLIVSVNVGGVSTECMRIDAATGNMGIGTSSPSSKLSVIGDAYVSGNLSAVTALKADTLNEYTSSNGVQIRGRTSGTAIAAGYVGEVISASDTSYLVATGTPAYNTWYDVTGVSINLTPGVWEVSAIARIGSAYYPPDNTVLQGHVLGLRQGSTLT